MFAYYYLGKTVRLHQAYILDRIINSKTKRIAVCWARQLGKSIALGIFLLWTCWYNKYPVTISSITVNYIVSKEDESAVELLEKVRLILLDGDRHMMQYTEDQHFFTDSLKEPNNTHQITFLNQCFIKSVPPTMKAVGKSASWLVIDEAHRLRCPDIDPDTFFDYAVALVAETGGGIILSSSPEGVVGFFHRAIDPDNQNEKNRYESFWLSHKAWDDDSPECKRYQEFVEEQRIRAMDAGRLKYWQQEYEALFTVTETSFFEHTDVEEAVKDTSQCYEWKETPACIGLDYGIKFSRTVITVRTMIKDELIQLFQYRCSADFDINHLINPDWEHSIQKLKERYNIFLIVPDDCPQGDSTNRWFESHSGIQVKKYNFRSDQMSKTDGINRNCLAYSYRAKLKEGLLKIPRWNTIQQFEMKIVQETEQKVLISIKAPTGHLCDTFDSDMMACLPFLDMQVMTDFEVDVPTGEEESVKKGGASYDSFHSPTDEECKDMIERANNGGEF